jgi:hypothetical protein
MVPLFVRSALLTSNYAVGDPTTDARIHTYHFDDENERYSALKQSQRSKSLSVITAKYTITLIMKNISKPGKLTSKTAAPL